MLAFPTLLLVLLWIVAIVAIVLITRRILVMRRGNERLSRLAGTPEKDALDFDEDEPNALRHWLYLSGFRTKDAPIIFILVALGFFIAGMALAWCYRYMGPYRSLMMWTSNYPGGTADIVIPILLLVPWAIIVVVSMVPWMVVRGARATRLRMIREDLPVILELLSTLCASGLTFDQAVERILRSHRRSRPLAIELRTWQADVLSGRSRVDCFRRMARRVDDMLFSNFCSALAQAEQMGTSMTDLLRQQADELRSRRRERALEFAMTAAVKLVVPMVLCFIPGMLVVALGPVFYNFMLIMDQMIGNRGLF